MTSAVICPAWCARSQSQCAWPQHLILPAQALFGTWGVSPLLWAFWAVTAAEHGG